MMHKILCRKNRIMYRNNQNLEVLLIKYQFWKFNSKTTQDSTFFFKLITQINLKIWFFVKLFKMPKYIQ